MEIRDLTIGIEEEYQIIDPDTRELTSYITEMLDQGAILFRDQVKPESEEYGICDDCGDDISMERLEARPVTTLCIA